MSKKDKQNKNNGSKSALVKAGYAKVEETKQGSSLGELEDRLSTEKLGGELEADIAKVFAVNWQKFAGFIVLLVVGVYLVEFYKNTQLNARGENAEKLGKVQEIYKTILLPEDVQNGEVKGEEGAKAAAEKAEKQATERKSLDENISLLVKSRTKSSYKELGKLYQATLALKEGKLSEAKEAVSGLAWAEGFDVAKQEKIDDKRFVQELASLIYARILINENKEDLSKVSAYLSQLCDNATFVNLEALLILANISIGEEQRDSVSKRAAAMMKAKPEIADSIKTELSSMGYSIPNDA